jgi:SpoVK/Ycf46/Vps4 family AAA+-type ATPase
VTRPGAGAQQEAWIAALGSDRAALASRLAGTFDFTPAAISRVAASAPEGADETTIWQSCVASVRPRLDALAQRIEPRAGWDDLVLPAEQESLLRQIADQVRQRRVVYDEWGYAARMSRGLGINALFTGESGTGKTLAAEVLAAELAINLYRIDLSAVVSKYIGETEKNLRQLFEAAEHGGVVLLFDEADALFGKRSEVKDSHDRYANIEVNYLLQRIESFHGLAILATNMKAALDSAFMRRMRFVVRFPHPGQAERTRMWQRAFPPAAPRERLDFERLGRINLTGGHIVAATLNAAFLAAAAGRAIAMQDVLQAARAELVKLNRPINEAEFGAPSPKMPASAAA